MRIIRGQGKYYNTMENGAVTSGWGKEILLDEVEARWVLRYLNIGETRTEALNSGGSSKIIQSLTEVKAYWPFSFTGLKLYVRYLGFD